MRRLLPLPKSIRFIQSKERYMKKLPLLALAFALLSCLAAMPALAQSSDSASADKTPASYDLKPQALQDIEQMQQKFVALAKAIPADKFTWRPGDGVRRSANSFSMFLPPAMRSLLILARGRRPASTPRLWKNPRPTRTR
jgi:hypothetical protein